MEKQKKTAEEIVKRQTELKSGLKTLGRPKGGRPKGSTQNTKGDILRELKRVWKNSANKHADIISAASLYSELCGYKIKNSPENNQNTKEILKIEFVCDYPNNTKIIEPQSNKVIEPNITKDSIDTKIDTKVPETKFTKTIQEQVTEQLTGIDVEQIDKELEQANNNAALNKQEQKQLEELLKEKSKDSNSAAPISQENKEDDLSDLFLSDSKDSKDSKDADLEDL